MKRLCNLILVLALLLTAIPLCFSATAEGTTETATDRTGWTAISTADEFLAITSGNCYYLTCDIDFGGATYQYLVEKFTGVLDGEGYALKNFSLANTGKTDGHMGVFGKVCDSNYTIIKNLVIGSETAPITMTNSITADGYHGFLAGQVMTDGNVGQFENITVYGTYTNTAEAKLYAGGLLGYGKKFVLKYCTFNGTLTDEQNNAKEKNLGGLVGLVSSNANRQNVIENCTNNANITAVGSGSVRSGGLVGFSGSPLKIENCQNTGNISGAKYAGGLVGDRYGSDLYVKNSSSVGTITGTNNGNILGGDEATVSTRYLYIVGCGDNDTAVTEVSTLADLQGMTTSGGIYRLANDLDLEGQSFENFVFSNGDGFNGVFDGNGYSIYNFTINGSASSDAGFFNVLTKNHDALIVNLGIGTAESPVTFNTVETSGKTIGVLVAACNNNATYSSLIDNVDIHANINHTGGKANIGGFMGISRRTAILNSTFDGDINVNMTDLGNTWLNCSAFVADVEADQTLFLNCANYANITISTTAGSDVRGAGFVAYATKNNEFIDCANFGDISVTGGTTPASAGLQVNLNGTSLNLASGCTNFGNLTAGKASGFFAWAKNPAVLYDCVNFGDVSGTSAGDTFYNDNTSDANTATKLACKDAENDLNFQMTVGASVRLNTPAGLRFKATVNTSGLYWTRLAKHATLSYGMLISPTTFVTNAGGFTKTALDAYGKTLGYTEGQSTYVTIDNTDMWYNDASGNIVGSLVNLQSSHYSANFSGLAYIDLTIDGETVYTIYADNAQSRSVKAVATSALSDVLYRKDGTLYNADGTAYTGSDAGEYTNVVESSVTLDGIDGTFEKVSPYTEQERTVLGTFAK